MKSQKTYVFTGRTPKTSALNKTSASHFEGENGEGFIKTNPDLPGSCIPPKTPSSSQNYTPFFQPSNADIPHAPEPIKPHLDKDPPETCLKHI
jgi:hypothetical protein